MSCLLVCRSRSWEEEPPAQLVHTALSEFLRLTLTKIETSQDAGLATDFAGFLRLLTGRKGAISLLGQEEEVELLFRGTMALCSRPGAPLELRLACLGTAENLMAHMAVDGLEDHMAKWMLGQTFSLMDWAMFGESRSASKEGYWGTCGAESPREVRASFRPWPRCHPSLRIEDGDVISLRGSFPANNSPSWPVAAYAPGNFQGGSLSWTVRYGRHNFTVL